MQSLQLCLSRMRTPSWSRGRRDFTCCHASLRMKFASPTVSKSLRCLHRTYSVVMFYTEYSYIDLNIQNNLEFIFVKFIKTQVRRFLILNFLSQSWTTRPFRRIFCTKHTTLSVAKLPYLLAQCKLLLSSTPISKSSVAS